MSESSKLKDFNLKLVGPENSRRGSIIRLKLLPSISEIDGSQPTSPSPSNRRSSVKKKGGMLGSGKELRPEDFEDENLRA